MKSSLREAYRQLSVRLASLTGASFIIEHNHIEFSPPPSKRRATRSKTIAPRSTAANSLKKTSARKLNASR